MIIVYHSRDLDGYTSGAILKKRFPEAQLIGYDYGQSLPELLPGEDIIMVDVSFPMDDLFRIAKESKSFTWIDHHISSMQDFYNRQAEAPKQLSVVLFDGLAACENAWNWAYPDEEMPYIVTLLGMYDTWRNKDKIFWDEVIMPFQFGMRMMCTSPESFPNELFNVMDGSEVKDIVDLGGYILKYQKEQNARHAKNNAFAFVWKEHRILAMNGSGFNSQAFEAVYNPEKHDIMMPFVYNGSYWNFSLYTEKDIDCSLLAKSMGGGGHKKAAGFKVTELRDLPFELI